MSLFEYVPISLIFTRFILAILLLLDALDGQTNHWFTVGLSIGIASDIVDGMIARKLGVADSHLRDLDSRVDFFFLVCLIAAAWIAHSSLILPHSPLLIFMFALYAISIIFPWLKFHRLPSYHAYSAKIAGLFLFAAAIELFTFNRASTLLSFALIIMMLSHLDRFAITLLLPRWQSDVPGVWHAWQIRREIS